ncbi:MAG: hypothetical protein J3Q66DRAFT_395529 [Benniella sp.]|nr:MAG: hypothetical protein J3Q66DRAFT_395529 [Benniella sp.]
MIHNSLSEVAAQDEKVVYIGGCDIEERSDTHADRSVKREAALQQAKNDLDKLEGLLTLDKLATKQLHRDITKNFGKAFSLSFDQRSELTEFLQEQGWSVRFSTAEEDIEIAKNCRPEDVVLTTDSDLLVYKNVETVWSAMGQTSQLGIATNLKVIQMLQGDTPKEIVDQYLLEPSVVYQNEKKVNIDMPLQVGSLLKQESRNDATKGALSSNSSQALGQDKAMIQEVQKF